MDISLGTFCKFDDEFVSPCEVLFLVRFAQEKVTPEPRFASGTKAERWGAPEIVLLYELVNSS